MKNRIFLVGPTESVLTKRGNRFPNIAEFLEEKDLDIQYLTSNFYHAEKRFFNAEEIKLETSKIKYNLIVFSVLGYYSNISIRRIFSNLFLSIQIFWYLLNRANRKDVVLIPSRPVELIFFISILKRIKGCKIVIDIQDIWPDALKIENKKKEAIFRTYCNIFLKPSLRHFDNAFHVAPSFLDWLNRYTSGKVKSTFIPLGWENKRWSTNKADKVFDINNIKLVCVAQLQHQIDVMPILKYLENNCNHSFTIIGEDGTGERYNEVINFINERNIKNVEIIGKVDRIEMTRLLSDKNIGVLPMITTSIPNKIFDYLASNLPIIVLGQNDSADFVEEQGFGVSCSFDHQGFQRALEKFDNQLFLKFSKSIEEKKSKFSRDELHNEIFKNLLK